DLINVRPRYITFAHRHHDFRLIVNLDLIFEIGNDEVSSARALVIEFSTAIELVGTDHANHMATGRQPFPEQNRVGGIGCGDGNVRATHGLFRGIHGSRVHVQHLAHLVRKGFAVLRRHRIDLEIANSRANGANRLHLRNGLLAGAQNANRLGIFANAVLGHYAGGRTNAQRRDGMIVHDAQQLVSIQIPDQYEPGIVAGKFHTLLTAFERKTDVRAVKPYGGDAVAWHDAGDDVHPSPALLGGGRFQRRVDASSRYHLGAAAAEISVGLLH